MADYDAKVHKKDGSQIEIDVKVSEADVQAAKEKTFKKLAKDVKLEGFRAGKAPKEMIEQSLGSKLYEATLNNLIPDITVEILEKEGLSPVDQVVYDIEKFEPGEGVEYKVKFPIFPEIKIGNLGKIKVKKEVVEVSDEDIDKVIENLFEEWKTAETAKAKGESEEVEKVEGAAEADEKIILKYSEPNDQWAKEETGLEAEDMAGLRVKIGEEVKKQKESVAEGEYQNKIMEEALKVTEMEVPMVFIERELDRRMDQYMARIEQLGLKFDDFLKVQNTSKEKLREGWADNAKSFVESELFLMQLAKDENIEVAEADIQKQIDDVEDDKTKAQFDNDEGREYIKGVLLRQQAFHKLMEMIKS